MTRAEPAPAVVRVDVEALGTVMSELARSLQEEHESVEETLRGITSAAIDAVPGTTLAGISLVTRKRVIVNRAATDPLVATLDELQTDLGEGPCLEALWEQHTVRVDDMATEERWPRFTSQAAAQGIRSMLAFQLFVTGDTLGALNLYARDEAAFGRAAEDIGVIFASHAAVALTGAQNEEALHLALDARDVIGQAKGILMERYKITAQQAFVLLTRTSQQTNTKLRMVAETLSSTGEIPSAIVRRPSRPAAERGTAS